MSRSTLDPTCEAGFLTAAVSFEPMAIYCRKMASDKIRHLAL
jgi:hypothetical protein